MISLTSHTMSYDITWLPYYLWNLCSIPPLHLWYHWHLIPCHMLSYDITDSIWYHITIILPSLCSIPPLHLWYHWHLIPCHMISYDITDSIWYHMISYDVSDIIVVIRCISNGDVMWYHMISYDISDIMVVIRFT